MPRARVLEIATRKLQYDHGLNQLCASLTPAEIHALLDAGYRPAPSCATRVPDRHGADPRPTWFYFTSPRGQFHEP